MLLRSRPSPSASASRRRSQGGFTIFEAAMAAAVLALGIATSLTALVFGMRSIDTARNMTLAGQIMQSELEILRLQNWAQIVALQNAQASATTPTVIDPSTTITSGTATTLDSTLTSIAGRFRCTRLVSDISGRTNIKSIRLNVSWSGIDGRTHQLDAEMRYAKNGLSDYFYVTH